MSEIILPAELHHTLVMDHCINLPMHDFSNIIHLYTASINGFGRPDEGTLHDVANYKKPTLPTKTFAARAAINPKIGDVRPKVEQKPKIESLSAAFSSKILQVNNIDENEETNPMLLPQYVNDICDHLRSLETKTEIKCNFLSANLVDGRMRAILVDWLVDVHATYSLQQETLFLAVAIIDLYLQETIVDKDKLQLVGVTSLYIASKYEEIRAPSIPEMIYMTNYAYTKPEMLQMERDILRKLDFGLGRPSPLHFLRRNAKAADVDATQYTMAKYFIELALVDYDFAHYKPSLMAATATYLSLKLDKMPWTDTVAHYSNYSECHVCPVARRLARLVLLENKPQAVTVKYGSEKLMNVSGSPQLRSKIMSRMAGARQK